MAQDIRRRLKLSVAMLACLTSFSAVHAQPPAAPKPQPASTFATLNEAIRTGVRVVTALALSPDGKSVVAQIVDTTADGGRPHLWLLAPGAQPRQLTFARADGKSEETAPAWSPDGRYILFMGARDDASTLYRLPLAGGEAERLVLAGAGPITASWSGDAKADPAHVSDYAYSPDSRYLAVSIKPAEKAWIKARKDLKDDASAFGVEPEGERVSVIDLATGQARAVALKDRFAGLKWSDTGAGLFITTDPGSPMAIPDHSVWRVDPATLAAERLDLPKTVKQADLLPDRAHIVFTAQCMADTPPLSCDDVYVKPIGGGPARNLTQGLDGAVEGAFHVAANGDVLVPASRHMQRALLRLASASGGTSWIETGFPVTALATTNAGGKAWAMVGIGSDRPASVLVTPGLGKPPVALATPPIAPPALGRRPAKLITWQNEGLTIEGLLYMPDAPAGTKVPLVVEAHGGPAGAFAEDYSPLVQLLLAEGWAVLRPNIRGSTGYGAAFLAADRNDLGGADFRDMMTGVDAVLKQYPIDANRMAMIGYSYGGEMAGFTVGKTDRFKAIVSGAPVINQFSEVGTEKAESSHYDRWYLGRPWLNFEDAKRQSPVAYAAKAKTPFLLLQGEDDRTDPLGQSKEMRTALLEAGAPVELVTYPREDHGDTGRSFEGMPTSEPWHGVDLRRRMLGFIRAAFADDPDPLAKARAGTPDPEDAKDDAATTGTPR